MTSVSSRADRDWKAHLAAAQQRLPLRAATPSAPQKEHSIPAAAGCLAWVHAGNRQGRAEEESWRRSLF
jgi:hypothetical protein